MQGAWVRPVTQEDPTCHEAAEPVDRNHRGPRSLCSATGSLLHGEKPVTAAKGSPHSATRESPGAASKTQHGQEFKMINHLKEVDPTFSINLPGSLSCSQEINAEGCILAFFPALLYDLKILS